MRFKTFLLAACVTALPAVSTTTRAGDIGERSDAHPVCEIEVLPSA
ncbi:MAG: hypothetical protein Q7K57_38030 [Burkholderiaceae bacterium]|nr:hypothetical protein [Burkholderiaceae bacterium]MDP3753320.1 hypothetical protein [Polaromonas sp.]